MKKIIQILILSVLGSSLFAQDPKILTPKLDPNKKSEYISKEFFECLTLEEQSSFMGCLSLFGIELDSLNWIDSEFIIALSNDSLNCNRKIIWKYTNDVSFKTKKIELSDSALPYPKCFVYLERFDNFSRFTFEFYY